MKKSVKKVLAALLSVLLFASLFTTTAFAAQTPGDKAVEASSEYLGAALDYFYGSVGSMYVVAENYNKFVYNAFVENAAKAIADNLIKQYPAIAAMIAAGIDPATALTDLGIILKAVYEIAITENAKAAVAECQVNMGDAIVDATNAYWDNFDKWAVSFVEHLNNVMEGDYTPADFSGGAARPVAP